MVTLLKTGLKTGSIEQTEITAALAENGERPPSNTGSDCQNVLQLDTNFSTGIDWIQGTGIVEKEELYYIFGEYLPKLHPNDQFVFEWGAPITVGIEWGSSGRSVKGIKAGFKLLDGEDKNLYKYWVGLPGSWLEAVPVRKAIRLIQDLYSLWQFRATRLDVKLDDHQSRITPEQIFRAYLDGNQVGFQTAAITKSKDGDTVYCGSRSSNNMTRVYHTAKKHGFDAVRVEREMKGDQADEFCKNLIKIDQDNNLDDQFLAQFLVNTAVGHIGFKDRSSGDKHISRLPWLHWWANFLEALEAIPLKFPVEIIKPTLEKKIAWLKTKVSRSFATVANSYKYCSGKTPLDFAKELLRLGDEKQDLFTTASSKVLGLDYALT